MNSPTNTVVLSVGETSHIQALERAQPILPMDVGQPERRTHNEHGTPFRWTRTADEILDKMRRFGLHTQQVHGR